MSAQIDWQRRARVLLQVELAKKDIGYKELSRALETTCGVDIEPKALSNKVGRGTFTFVFFLQCMYALGVDTVKLQR